MRDDDFLVSLAQKMIIPDGSAVAVSPTSTTSID
jgi:hypothetical protein